MQGAELENQENQLINSTQHRQELAWGWLSRLSLAILLSGANLMLVFKVPSNRDFLSCSSAVSFLDSLVLSLSNEITLGRLKSGIFCSSSFMSHFLAQKSLRNKKKSQNHPTRSSNLTSHFYFVCLKYWQENDNNFP